jgi:chromosome segregation ATPase
VQRSQLEIEELQKNLRDSQQAVEELAERASQAEQAFEQLDADLQAKEEKLMEHQQTLAKNRDLIVMLKDEYKKVSDKEKVMVLANT